eukprot:TRINITY_DN51417_c0_g1_i1.p1 TRINITY_DN51417_c0_g1~~TRINITY_DN51417_c0_g1_i1.p1  ORF type:complete len:218 (-),score=42.35 TRINITY_DN51417_c0_g1_i1:130-732(-)
MAFFSFYDMDIHEDDCNLLNPGRWLNDALISAYFVFLRATNHDINVEIIDPIGTMMMKIGDEEDLESFSAIQKKDQVMWAFNDEDDPTQALGGNHWTLLVFSRERRTFQLYDSASHPISHDSAREFASKMADFLGMKEHTFIIEKCPQQRNCSDCGVFILEFAEQLIKNGLSHDIVIKSGDILKKRDTFKKMLQSSRAEC